MQTITNQFASAAAFVTAEQAAQASADHAAKLATIAGKLTAKRAQANRDAANKPAQSKPANAKAAAKRVASKPATVKPAKPTAEAREAAQRANADKRSLERGVAFAVVSQFYNGRSLPFKAASNKLSPLNGASRVCSPSERTGACVAAIILAGGNGAIRADGSFVRTALRAPARLFDRNAPADALVNVQPESGCVADRRGVVYSYASESAYSRESVITLNVKAALGDVSHAGGDKLRNACLQLLVGYGVREAVALDKAERKAAGAQPKLGRANVKAA